MSNPSKLRFFVDNVVPTLIGKANGPTKAASASLTSVKTSFNKIRIEDAPGGGGGDDPPAEFPEPEFNRPLEARQPTLRLGDKSADGWVEYLQERLNDLLDPSPNLKEDGNFDQATQQAVIAYQKQNGLVIDGTVGNQTWASLRDADPEMASTDGREPHTYVEKGLEARWYSEDPVMYTPDNDTLTMLVVSVGDDVNIEGRKAEVFVTEPVSKKRKGKVFQIGPAEYKTKTGQGNNHLVVIRDFTGAFSLPKGTRFEACLVEAYLEDKLGGDFYSSAKHGGVRVTDGPSEPKEPKEPKDPKIPQTGTATLEVHVHDREGKPVEGATVSLSTGPTPKPPLETNTAGIARFEGLADGDYHVNAKKADVVWQPSYVRKGKLAPGQTYPVVLSKPAKASDRKGNLEVTVTHSDGTAASAVSVILTPLSGGERHDQQTDRRGRTAFIGIEAGHYQVSAFDDGENSDGEKGSTTAQVNPNDHAICKLRLNKPPKTGPGEGSLEIAVTRSDGTSADGIAVILTPLSGGEPHNQQTDNGGRTTFIGIAAGNYGVSAVDIDGESGSASAHVKADDCAFCQLRLRPARK